MALTSFLHKILLLGENQVSLNRWCSVCLKRLRGLSLSDGWCDPKLFRALSSFKVQIWQWSFHRTVTSVQGSCFARSIASATGNSDALMNIWRSFMNKSVQIPMGKNLKFLCKFYPPGKMFWKNRSEHQPHLQRIGNDTWSWSIQPVWRNICAWMMSTQNY